MRGRAAFFFELMFCCHGGLLGSHPDFLLVVCVLFTFMWLPDPRLYCFPPLQTLCFLLGFPFYSGRIVLGSTESSSLLSSCSLFCVSVMFLWVWISFLSPSVFWVLCFVLCFYVIDHVFAISAFASGFLTLKTPRFYDSRILPLTDPEG